MTDGPATTTPSPFWDSIPDAGLRERVHATTKTLLAALGPPSPKREHLHTLIEDVQSAVQEAFPTVDAFTGGEAPAAVNNLWQAMRVAHGRSNQYWSPKTSGTYAYNVNRLREAINEAAPGLAQEVAEARRDSRQPRRAQRATATVSATEPTVLDGLLPADAWESDGGAAVPVVTPANFRNLMYGLDGGIAGLEYDPKGRLDVADAMERGAPDEFENQELAAAWETLVQALRHDDVEGDRLLQLGVAVSGEIPLTLDNASSQVFG